MWHLRNVDVLLEVSTFLELTIITKQRLVDCMKGGHWLELCIAKFKTSKI